MARLGIVYFSGTGNTEVITNLIASEFRKSNNVDVIRVEDILKHKTDCDPEKYSLLGVGYPIYGFNAPKIIGNFVGSLKRSDGKRVFIYSTSAGPTYFNDIASYGLKNKLKKKGFNVIYEKQFYMPPNIAIKYHRDVVMQLYNAAILKTKRMVNDINQEVRKVRDDGIMPLFFRWMYLVWEELAWQTVPMDFKVLKSCNLCKKCMILCPQDNIVIKNGRIKFRWHCLACYRCVYNCPVKAITGRLYKFAILKEGYDLKKIITNEKIRGNYINDSTTGYYKVFYKYLNEEK